MKIHEYQAKKFFSDYAIPVERHILCNTAQEVTAAFSQLGNEKVAIKAQVLSGGRERPEVLNWQATRKKHCNMPKRFWA